MPLSRFFRRRRGRFSMTAVKGKPDTFWVRGRSTLGVSAAVGLAGVDIFRPQTFVAGDRDDSFTVLRVVQDWSFIYVQDVLAVVPFLGNLRVGTWVDDQDSATDNPRFAAATDQRTDWMDLFSVSFVLQVQPGVGAVARGECPCPGQNHVFRRDIRVRRKVEQNEALSVAVSADLIQGLDTAQAVLFSSVLVRKSKG